MTAPVSTGSPPPGSVAPADADLALSTARAASGSSKLRQTNDPAVAEKTARDFESVFLAEMLRPIFATVKPDTEFGGGHGEEVFQSLLVDEYAKQIAHSKHSIGIAEAVKKVILKTQDSEQPRPTASPRAARAYKDPSAPPQAGEIVSTTDAQPAPPPDAAPRVAVAPLPPSRARDAQEENPTG